MWEVTAYCNEGLHQRKWNPAPPNCIRTSGGAWAYRLQVKQTTEHLLPLKSRVKMQLLRATPGEDRGTNLQCWASRHQHRKLAVTRAVRGASQTSTRAVRVTPLSNPQLRMNLQGRAPLFPCSFWGATASAEGAHHFLPLLLAFGYRSATAAPAPLPLALPLLAPFPWRAVPTQRTIW